MAPTQTTDDGTVDPARARAIGTAFYDSLMVGIEPELVSSRMPQLKEQYNNESPEQAAARAARYDAAFDEYDRRAAVQMEAMDAGLSVMRRDALKTTEHDNRTEESDTLSDLERSISDQ
jgi:hypothetical protein